MLVIPPTALHGFVFSTDVAGHVLTLSDTLLESLFPTSSTLTPMLSAVQCLTLFEEPYPPAMVSHLIRQIDEELFAGQPEKQAMLQACLQRLFLVLYRLWQHHEVGSNRPNDPAITYFRQFQQRVRQVGVTNSIVQLADELAITPVHLNRICRAVADKSAN